jgi:hypothetical protein
VEDGHVRLDRDRPAHEFDGPRRITLLEGHRAEQVQGIDMRRVAVEEDLVDPRRPVQEAPLMTVQSRAQIFAHPGCYTR